MIKHAGRPVYVSQVLSYLNEHIHIDIGLVLILLLRGRALAAVHRGLGGETAKVGGVFGAEGSANGPPVDYWDALAFDLLVDEVLSINVSFLTFSLLRALTLPPRFLKVLDRRAFDYCRQKLRGLLLEILRSSIRLSGILSNSVKHHSARLVITLVHVLSE